MSFLIFFQLFGRGKTFSPFPGVFKTLSEISQQKLNVTHLLPRAVGSLISRQRIARPKRNRQNESYFLGGRDTVDCALVDLHSQFQELKDFCWAFYLVVGFSFQGSLWVLFGCGTFVCFLAKKNRRCEWLKWRLWKDPGSLRQDLFQNCWWFGFTTAPRALRLLRNGFRGGGLFVADGVWSTWEEE